MILEIGDHLHLRFCYFSKKGSETLVKTFQAMDLLGPYGLGSELGFILVFAMDNCIRE